MPQRIDVPGMGIVEFPDGMNDDQIASAIKQNMPQPSIADKLTGNGTPRYQTWPERLIRGIGSSLASGASLPGDVMAGKADPNDTGRVLDLAGMALPLNPAARAGDQAIPGMAKVLNKPEAPTAQALFNTAGKGFDAAREAGVAIPGSGMQRLG